MVCKFSKTIYKTTRTRAYVGNTHNHSRTCGVRKLGRTYKSGRPCHLRRVHGLAPIQDDFLIFPKRFEYVL